MIVAASGHRFMPIGQGEAIVAALQGLQVLGATRLYCGMARGWDTMAGLAALMLDIPVVACIPFEKQVERWWDPADVARRQVIIDRAERVVIVGDRIEFSPAAYYWRNVYMVNESQAILALYNGHGIGGAAGCLRYAADQRRPILNVLEVL